MNPTRVLRTLLAERLGQTAGRWPRELFGETREAPTLRQAIAERAGPVSPRVETPTQAPRTTARSPDAGQSGAGQNGGFTAYHGSPHEFDNFDTAYAQTGEGANVQGRGLYFAEREDVASAYRFNNVQEGQTPMGVARDILGDTRGNYDEAIEQVRDGLQSDPQRPLWREALEILERREVPMGNVYRAHINADPATLLDLDAPLSRQPEAVRRLIGRRLRSNATGQEVFNDIRQRYGENAEQILRMEGVPGIKYLDQGSRGVGAGTRNYVMFDHGDIQIMERNGVPVRPTRQANAPDGGASGVGNTLTVSREQVPLRGLRRTQETYDPERADSYWAGRDDFPPILVARETDGSFTLFDGHNRTRIGQRRGLANMDAYVVPRAELEARFARGQMPEDITDELQRANAPNAGPRRNGSTLAGLAALPPSALTLRELLRDRYGAA